MPSAFADRFHAKARPRLQKVHGEMVIYRLPNGHEQPVTVTWRRYNARTDEAVGAGADRYQSEATAVVTKELMPDPDGLAVLIRDDTLWEIRFIESQDEWTWVLYLARRIEEVRLPSRIRAK